MTGDRKDSGHEDIDHRRAEELMMAFGDSERVNHVGRYRTAGRRFARLSDDELNQTWVNTLLPSYGVEWQPEWYDWSDAEAELMLRRLPRPYHLIPAAKAERLLDRGCTYLWRYQSTYWDNWALVRFMREFRAPRT